jgi:hypothetical protein
MFMHAPAQNDRADWKRVYAQYRGSLHPNRISGAELYDYLSKRYPFVPLDDPRMDQIVVSNILENEVFARELPQGVSPDPVCCAIENNGSGEVLYRDQDAIFSGSQIIAGIDLVSGYFLVEGSSLLWDELYARRGLNENDLANEYAVAEYVACLKRFGQLGQMPDETNK